MNRRAAVSALGLITLHALYPSVLLSFLSSCQSGEAAARDFTFFTPSEGELVKEVIDIILPRTQTASASEAAVHLFLDDVFAVCLSEEQQAVIREGLATLQKGWKEGSDKSVIITALDNEAYSGAEGAAWFKTLKQCTLIGFFTSREGTTKAGDYQKIPDKYMGEVRISEHTLAHSKTSLTYNF